MAQRPTVRWNDKAGWWSYFIDTTFNLPTRSDAYKYAAYDGLGRIGL